MSKQQTDRELVERVKQGDDAAFDLLVRKYQRKILAVISRYVHDWSEAEDVSQDAFLRAYRALKSFRGDSAFYTWMYKIATNTAKNHLVSRGRRPPATDIAMEDAEHYESFVRFSDTASPEHELLRQEIEQTVFRTVQELPEDLRQAINLRESEGLSYEEIAQRMDCPIGTVRSRIFRAREAIDDNLRPLLSEENEPDE